MTPVRRRFEDLHPKDQQIKQTKKMCMEHNWQCPIQECLPETIRPRVEVKKGAKARMGDPPAAYEHWWNWSVELLKALEEFSEMTAGELDFAQDILSTEVEQRQRNPKSTQRKIIELLLGDVQKVVDEQRKSVQAGFRAGFQAIRTHPEHAVAPVNTAKSSSTAVQGSSPQTYDVPDHASDGADQDTQMQLSPKDERSPSSPCASFTHNANEGRVAGAYSDLRLTATHLRTTELKARAARLRAEAARAEATAIQLEIEAIELREQLQFETRDEDLAPDCQDME